MEMKLEVNPRSPVPLHAQIAEQLELAIAKGALKPGEQLPTVRQLSVELRVNSNTVARVYAELERRAVLETFRGKGTFVRQRPKVDTEAARGKRLAALCRDFVRTCAQEGFGLNEVREALTQLSER
jgi:GntR family transcriptional regulator